MAINIPVNTGGILLTAGGSATGSFGGMLALAGGPSASIAGLKYINGYTVSNPGSINPGYLPFESTMSSFGLAAGSKLELLITSCSLAAGSSPVILYT
jgi:hypothetical protein